MGLIRILVVFIRGILRNRAELAAEILASGSSWQSPARNASQTTAATGRPRRFGPVFGAAAISAV